MTKKLSNSQVDDRLVDIKRLDDYIDKRTPINFECLICNYVWKVAPSNLITKSGTSCPKCKNQVPPTNEEIDNKLLNKNLYRISDYINKRTKILFGCKLCGNTWETLPFHVLKEGCECPKCFGTNRLTDEFINNKLILKNIIKIDDYKQSLIPINFKCLICNYIWKTRLASIIHNDTGCPVCNSNKNEKKCKLFFKNLDAQYEFLYKNIFSINKNYRADIYLNKFRLIIEVQGAHHYKPVRYNSVSIDKATEKYEKQIIRDDLIRSLCKEYNFNLIEIDIHKNDNQKIDAILSNINANLSRLEKFIDDKNINIK